MTLYRKMVFTLVVLLFFVIPGCSDEENKSAPVEQKVEVVHPVVTLSKLALEAENEENGGVEEERTLKVGVVGPETGVQAAWGQSVMNGVVAAAGRFNRQGGIDGKEIEVLRYNTGENDSPRLTELAVTDLVRKKAVAIISAPTAWSTFAPIHIVNKSQTIFMSVGSRRRIGKSGPYIFRNSLADESATDDLIKYTSEKLNYSEYAMVTSSQYDYSLDLSAQFKKAIFKYGGTLSVDVDTYDTYTGNQDLNKVMDAINDKADTLHGVIFTGGSGEGLNFAQEMRRAGLDQPILGGEDLFTMEYLSGGEAVVDSLLYATFAPYRKSSKVAEFKQDYGEDNPDRFAALAYDSFMLIAQAIKTAKSTKTSRVRDAIIAIKDFEGATGKTSFSSVGAPFKEAFIYRVIKNTDGAKFALLQ